MYDQAANGLRVTQLGLGRHVVFDELFHTTDGAGPSTPSMRLEVFLAQVSAPAQRLRCACVGRDVRADPAEDGLSNAVAILKKVLDSALASHTVTTATPEPSCTAEPVAVAATTYPQCKELVAEDGGLVTFPNGLRLFAHVDSAPEETVFLYEEIFERQIYRAFAEDLQDGDVVVDAGCCYVHVGYRQFDTHLINFTAGANVGMFSLYAAGVHLNDGERRKQLNIIAIEPIEENAELLCKNLDLHGVSAVVYRCALTSLTAETALEEPATIAARACGAQDISLPPWTGLCTRRTKASRTHV
jgi:hypothetical protein